MAKKQKKTTPERIPTKHQLSKWQRQMKIRRIVIIAAVVFLVGISSWVGYGYYGDYRDRTAAWREVMIEVNGVPFTMEYFVNVLDAFTQGMNSTTVSQWGSYLANIIADNIIDAELLKQGAQNLNITVTDAEVTANLTALAAQVSCNASVEGDLGWLPEELMPNSLIAGAAFNSTLGEISQPIYDATAVKELGYWLIEVTYRQDDQVNALAMLLGSKAEADRIRTQLAAGGNFSTLAGNYSQHISKSAGGRLDGLGRGVIGTPVF